jgi:hypothetical protein
LVAPDDGDAPPPHVARVVSAISATATTAQDFETILPGYHALVPGQFDIHGFVVQPRDGVLIILAIGATFFGLCVKQFRKADFSRVTVFKRGHHR